MSHIATFLNTKVENTGVLSDLGNFGLMPVRYLFGGQTMRYSPTAGLHRVASFHVEGARNQSRSAGRHLVSSETGMIKTALAMICLVPGIFLAIFKMLSYIFPDVRESHRLAQQLITPVDRDIGSADEPITSWGNLYFILDNGIEGEGRPINNLIIYGDGSFQINRDILFQIHRLNPMKVHLMNASLKEDVSISDSSKWREHTKVDSLETAKKIEGRRRGVFTFKRYHLCFQFRV